MRSIVKPKNWTKKNIYGLINNKFTVGFYWSLLSVLSSKGSTLIASFFIAQMLGKSNFGKLGLIQSTLAMFGAFAGIGVNLTMTKFVAEQKLINVDFVSELVRQFGLLINVSGLFFSFLLFLLSPWLANEIIKAPELLFFLRITSAIIFFEAVSGYLNSILFGFQAFQLIAKMNTIIGVLSFLLLIGLTNFLNLEGAVIALLINSIIGFILSFLFFKTELRKHNLKLFFEKKFTQTKILLNFSLPALLSTLMVAPAFWVCNTMMVNKAASFYEIGVYNAANQWRSFIIFIPATLGNVVLPYLSSYLGESNEVGYNKFFKISLITTLVISLVTALPLLAAAPWIMGKYGVGFEDGFLVLDLIILSSILITVNGVIGMSIITKGLLWLGFFLNLLWAISLIGFSYIFINLGYGAIGLAAANLVAYSLHTIWQFLLLSYNNKKQKILERS